MRKKPNPGWGPGDGSTAGARAQAGRGMQFQWENGLGPTALGRAVRARHTGPRARMWSRSRSGGWVSAFAPCPATPVSGTCLVTLGGRAAGLSLEGFGDPPGSRWLHKDQCCQSCKCYSMSHPVTSPWSIENFVKKICFSSNV